MSELLEIQVEGLRRVDGQPLILEVDPGAWSELSAEEQDMAVRQNVTQYYEDLGDPGAMDRVNQAIGGFNETFYNTAEGALNLAEGALNLPARGLNKLFGWDVPLMDNYGDGTIKNKMSDWNMHTGHDPRVSENWRKGGEYAGEAALAMSLMGAGSQALLAKDATRAATKLTPGVTNMLKGLTWQVKNPAVLAGAAAIDGGLTLAGRNGGEAVGRNVAENFGFNPETGAKIGATVGEMALTTFGDIAVDAATGPVSRALFSTPDTPRLKALADTHGIPASPSLIGGDAARTTEKAVNAIPFVGKKVEDVSQAQIDSLAEATGRVADNLRPPSAVVANAVDGPSAPRPYPGGVGTRVSEAAETALDTQKGVMKNLSDQEISLMGGPDAGVDISAIRREAENAVSGAAEEYKILIKNKLKNLEATRTTPIDPGLDTQLRADLSTFEAQLARVDAAMAGTPNPSPSLVQQRASLAQTVQRTTAAIDANMGVSVPELDSWRGLIGNALEGSDVRLDGAAGTPLYRGVKTAQTDQAATLGNATELAATTEQKRLLIDPDVRYRDGGDLVLLDQLNKKKNKPGSIYAQLFGKEGIQNPDQLAVLKRNVTPDQWDNIRADVLELMTTPTTSGQINAAQKSFSFSPAKFNTEWQNMPLAFKKTLFSDDTIKSLDELVALSLQVTARRMEGGGAQATKGNVAIATTIGLANHTLATIGTLASAGLAGDIFLSNKFQEILAGESADMLNTLTSRFIKETAQQAVPNETPAAEAATLQTIRQDYQYRPTGGPQ